MDESRTEIMHKEARYANRQNRIASRATGYSIGLTAILGTGVAVAFGLESLNVKALALQGVPTAIENLELSIILINAVVVSSIGLFTYALTNSFPASIGAVSIIGAIAGFAHLEKMRLREEPLYPADVAFLRDIGFLIDAISGQSIVTLGIGVLIAFTIAATWLAIRRFINPKSSWRGRTFSRKNWQLRLMAGVFGATALFAVSQFHNEGNPVRGLYETNGARWILWSQNANYRDNGFTAGFLFNLPGPVMDAPAGYSAGAIDTIVDRWAEAARSNNAPSANDVVEDMNVVIILSESFADPLEWEGLEFPIDPIPYTRDLTKGTVSGTMLSSGYGGGTANVEWEVLTGFSVRKFAPQMRSPFQRLLPFVDSYPSQLDRIRQSPDRKSIAIHPFLSSFYQRSSVYPSLGYDQTHFIEDFDSNSDRIEDSRYISDIATYRKALGQLHAEPQPITMTIVTMQNHSPFSYSFGDPIWPEGNFDVDTRREIAHYARGLSHSDEALAWFLSGIENLEDPTLVLFYGDHLPSIVPGEIWDTLPPSKRFETPFFVWSTEPLQPIEIPPVVGPNHLVSIALESVGAPQSPLDALLRALREVSPARTPLFTLDAEGLEIADWDLSDQEVELLNDYAMLQYDIAVGDRHSEPRLYAPVVEPRE